KAADNWIVQSGAKLGNAEGGKGVAAVPLLVAVKRAARLGACRGRLAERSIVNVLYERAAFVGEEPVAPRLPEREDPRASCTVLGRKEAIGPWDLAQQDLRARRPRSFEMPCEQCAELLVLTDIGNRGSAASRHVKFLDFAERVVAKVRGGMIVVDR